MRRLMLSMLLALWAPSVLGVFACSPAGPSSAPASASRCESFDWLVGSWSATADGITTQERWRVVDAGLAGHNRVSKGGAVVFEEALRIETSGERPLYRASPSGQAPHDFPMRSCTTQHAVFADPTHDFPQTLDYRREGTTLTVIATGEGTDGRPREARWTWTLERGASSGHSDRDARRDDGTRL